MLVKHCWIGVSKTLVEFQLILVRQYDDQLMLCRTCDTFANMSIWHLSTGSLFVRVFHVLFFFVSFISENVPRSIIFNLLWLRFKYRTFDNRRSVLLSNFSIKFLDKSNCGKFPRLCSWNLCVCVCVSCLIQSNHRIISAISLAFQTTFVSLLTASSLILLNDKSKNVASFFTGNENISI